MFERYPKSGKRMLGEQKAATFASAKGSVKSEYNRVGSKDRYPAKGHIGPTSRHSSHEKACAPYATGKSGGLQSETYPAKGHSKFGTEKVANKLVPPMSRPPKEM